MAFLGYLFGRGSTIPNTESVAASTAFPHQFIDWKSWNSLPNSREEIKAYRDENTRNLTRVTAKGTKSSFSFSTRDSITLEEKKQIQQWINDTIGSEATNKKQRRMTLWYWNDEENKYKLSDFYCADIQFKIKLITKIGNDPTIIYEPIEISFVEY